MLSVPRGRRVRGGRVAPKRRPARQLEQGDDVVEITEVFRLTTQMKKNTVDWENAGVEIVKLIVGRERKEFSIHKSFICQASEAMKASFCGEFEEARTGVMSLVEDEPLVVQTFIAYCYPNFDGEALKERALTELVDLYIFADKYRCQKSFQNLVMDSIQDKMLADHTNFNEASMKHIFSNTTSTQEAPIRKYAAALIAHVLHPLVAVIVGGTSGISEYAIRSLIQTHSSLPSAPSLRIYIIGRNTISAQKTNSECKTICPGPEIELIFVKAEDLSLLKDVDRVCEEVVRLEREKEQNGGGKARVDWLVMSQSNSVQSFRGRKLTSEGLDIQFSLHYYSRMRFVARKYPFPFRIYIRLLDTSTRFVNKILTLTKLLPFLLTSTLPTGAHITSIYAAGMESTLHVTDLSLHLPTHYTFSTPRSHVVHMTTLFFESLVHQHAGKLVATHVYPGLVVTPGMYLDGYPWWFRVLRGVFGGLGVVRLVSLGAEEAGARMVWTVAGEGFVFREGEGIVGTDGVRGGGAYAVGRLGEVCHDGKAYKEIRKGRLKEKVWEHTWKAFAVIEGGGVFKE
ncbi:hypothetical protein DL98DRAFT_657332 [Cadophora sp. DSE1049]|nr:hypothetical protein DL98DRAFT_657332 [Cadophora sp. DSE1049]